MDTNNHTQLIARLKRQPRHGAGPFADLIALLATGAEVTATALAITSLDTAVLKLTDSTSLIVRGLEKQVAIQRAINTSYIELAKASLFLELRNKELNKTFGLNSAGAAKFSSKLQDIASDLKITGIQAQQYAISIKKMLPTLNQMATKDEGRYKGLIRVQQIMTTNLGLSEKEAEENAYFATQRGKNANDSLASQHALSKAIEDTTGLQGSFKMISQGIAETSADVQLQYGKMPGNLELAILKAKSLGFTMATLKSTADNLLNIESSIGQELEYQLLSGRRLVDTQGKSLTNAYREASLQGNGLKQADTLNTILEQEGETLANNLFARQQMSRLLGMDEAALARALQKKSILEKIGGGELFKMTGDALLDAAKGLEGVEQADMDALAAAEDTRTTDEKLLANSELQTDVLIKGLGLTQEYAVKKASDAAIAGAAETSVRFGDTKKLLGESALYLDAVKQAGTIGAKLISAETIEVSQMNVASGAGGAIKMDDMVSPPSGYGTRTLSGPEGAIQLNNKDTVIAGTNLFDKSSTDNVALSNTMLQVGAMIVAAIKSGGINLNERYSV